MEKCNSFKKEEIRTRYEWEEMCLSIEFNQASSLDSDLELLEMRDIFSDSILNYQVAQLK